jgi:hypothetical protein
MMTEGQRRALTVGLRAIETELGWIETVLGWRREGVLTTFDDDLRDAVHRELRTCMDEARELIGGLARTLQLEPEMIRKSRWISGHVVQLWVVTEECQSRALRAYGEVGPDLPAVVDPVVQRLGEILLSMQRIARGPEHEVWPADDAGGAVPADRDEREPLAG